MHKWISKLKEPYAKYQSMIFANGPNKVTWIKGIFILVLGPPAFLSLSALHTNEHKPCKMDRVKMYYRNIYGKQVQIRYFVGIGTCPFGFVKVKLTGVGHQKSFSNQPTKLRSSNWTDWCLSADWPALEPVEEYTQKKGKIIFFPCVQGLTLLHLSSVLTVK